MPKAKVWESGAVEGQITEENRWVEIGWTKGHSFVQVGVGCGDGDPLPSHWMTIDDRSAINRLIRELRNARDQAFGRDE